MTTVEQILLKLGIDTSQVDPGLDNFKRKVGSVMHGGWFTKVGSSGKAFKKVLGEIAEQSPIMGNALRMALSPIVGTMIAATAIFAFFTKQIQESDEALNKMSENNSRSLGSMREAVRSVADEMRKLAREFQNWVTPKDERAKRITQELTDQTAEMDSQQRIEEKRLQIAKQLAEQKIKRGMESGAISQSAGIKQLNALESEYATKGRALQKKFAQQSFDANSETLRKLSDLLKTQGADVDMWERAATDKVGAMRVERAKSAVDAIKSQLEFAKGRTSSMTGAYNEAMAREAKPGILGGAGGNWFEGKYMTNEKIEEEYHRRQQAERDLQKQLDRAQESLRKYQAAQDAGTDKLKEAQKAYDETKGKWEGASDAVEKARQKLDELNKTPLTAQQQSLQAASKQMLPSIDQLAQMGEWKMNMRTHRPVFVQSPAMAMARQIEALQNDALASAAWGNMDRHNADVQRANALKDQLAQAGIIDPKQAAQDTVTQLKELTELAKGGGLNVNVKGGVD